MHGAKVKIYSTLFYSILFYSILFYSILFYSILNLRLCTEQPLSHQLSCRTTNCSTTSCSMTCSTTIFSCITLSAHHLKYKLQILMTSIVKFAWAGYLIHMSKERTPLRRYSTPNQKEQEV
jgi:hypothetical protein